MKMGDWEEEQKSKLTVLLRTLEVCLLTSPVKSVEFKRAWTDRDIEKMTLKLEDGTVIDLSASADFGCGVCDSDGSGVAAIEAYVVETFHFNREGENNE
jgi:hypothetical protein